MFNPTIQISMCLTSAVSNKVGEIFYVKEKPKPLTKKQEKKLWKALSKIMKK